MSKAPLRYQTFEHTADIGIEIFGSSLADLFENAAWGFLDTLTDATKVERREKQKLVVSAGSREELLVRWLSELLFLYDTERKLFGHTKVLKLADQQLEAEVQGEKFDPLRHAIRYEIKAVTYHALSVREDQGLWKARVIFDI